MNWETERTEEEVNDLVDRASELENRVGSKFPGMTYEQGIRAMYDYLSGNNDDPLED